MEFSDYVDARRTTLVRAAVLLGHSTQDAEQIVQATLTKAFRSWRRIQRGDDIDTDVCRLLIYEAQQHPQHHTELGDGLTAGMAARRRLAEMTTEDREILVLRYFLDLPEATTAELLRLNYSEVSVADERSARTLVQEASETIDVAPAAFVPSSAGRRTPLLGLVAGVFALLIGLGIALGWWSADEKPDEVIPNSKRQVPSVFGYDANSARQLLETQGWDVENVDAASCEPIGRALGTVPQAGAAPPSEQVTLLVSVPADDLGCSLGQGIGTDQRALAWQVLDFTRDSATLQFADDVTVYVDGHRERISGAKAARRNTPLMQDLIRVLSLDANAVRVESGTWTKPLLTTEVDRGDSQCGGLDLPKEFGNRTSLLMYAAMPAFNSTPTGECHFLNVFSTRGVVEGLVLRTGATAPDGTMRLVVPDVVGLDVLVARKTLRSDGFRVQTEETDGCPGTTVLVQKPEADAIAKGGSRVILEIGRETANTCL